MEGTRPTIKQNAIPDKLKLLDRWACWRYEPTGKGKKPSKPPFNPRTSKYANPTDPSTWVSFDEAWKAYKAGSYDGISFALTDSDSIVGIDLDGCRNASNKRISGWAMDIIADLDSYTEVSPSGCGIRIFLDGQLPQNRHKGKVEAYCTAKFLTVTGHRLRNQPAVVEQRPKELAAFYSHWFTQEQQQATSPKFHITVSPDREPPANKLQALLRQRKSREAYEGTSDHGSQSERDQSLANFAAGSGWEPQEIADLLIQARFNVGEEPKHVGYYEATIGKAMNSDLAKKHLQRIPGRTISRPSADGKRKPPRPIRNRKQVSSVAGSGLASAKEVFRRHLHLEDDSLIDLILGLAAGNRLPGDPVWLYLVGPPSCGKTELLLALDGLPDVYLLSNLTSASLISGYKEPGTDTDYSLLPQLDGKLVVFKDFTTIISQSQESQGELLGILRDCYDGTASKAFGTSALKRFDSRFNILAGVTPDIERQWKLNTLGERFLMRRLHVANRLDHVRRALANANGSTNVRRELQKAVSQVLDNVPNVTPTASDELRERTLQLANGLATWRTYIARERNDEVNYTPEPELGSRVAKQLFRIGQSVALVRGRTELNADNFAVMRQVALDSMPGNRLKVLRRLWQNFPKAHTLKQFQSAISGSSGSTVKRALDDFALLGVAIKTSANNRTTFGLTNAMAEACQSIEL